MRRVNILSDDGTSRLVAQIKLEDGRFELGSDAPEPEVERVIAVVNASGADEAEDLATSPAARWARLLSALESEGYRLEDATRGDIQFNFEMVNDRLTGRQTLLHSGAVPFSPEVEARVASSIRGTLANLHSDLTARITSLLGSSRSCDAASAFLDAWEEGLLGIGATEELVSLLDRVSVSDLPEASQASFLAARCAVAQQNGEYVLAARDAKSLLDDGRYDTPNTRVRLEVTCALGERAEGKLGTALIALSTLSRDADIDTRTLAWVHRNISAVLPTGEPECERSARQSSDLFLTMGERLEAAASLMRVVSCRLQTAPTSAQKILDEVESLLEASSPGTLDLRARVLLARARVALSLERQGEAYQYALQSADILSGLLGAEQEWVAALSIVVGTGKALGHEIQEHEVTLASLVPAEFGESASLRLRALELLKHFDREEAHRLRDEVRLTGAVDIEFTLNVIIATRDTELTDLDKLSLLEASRDSADSRHDRVLVLTAIGEVLNRLHQGQGALTVYQEILSIDPSNLAARNNTGALLLRLGKFLEAVRFFEDQVLLWGDLPGIKFCLGKALRGLGELSRAANVFAGVALNTGVREDIREAAGRQRDELLHAGATLDVPERVDAGAVSLEYLEELLDEFAAFVKRDRRMSFWRRDGSKHKWISKPESHASDLLHSFIEGRLGERVEVVRERDAGAGRIDLYLSLRGGLRVVVELKMLGKGYSSGYAFGGNKQIVHYMDNRECRLGYLIIFDARSRDWALTPKERTIVEENLVVCKFIDVRPSVDPAAE